MSELTEKTIGELLEYNFFIPSYQRGYRWTERQIEDLLEDLNAFVPNQICNTESKTWYCLQPVVLKQCDERTKQKNKLQNLWYEVIDGQQRLTSIFLILHYANEMWVGKQKIPEFQLNYETREGSFEFLENQIVDEIEDKVIINDENIDFHHITKAYNQIHTWVKTYKNKYGKDFDNNDFLSKLKSHSKVIWYEVDTEKDAIEIFTRINMGKIPLTNAELIKALFLNSSNFKDTNEEGVRLKQLEIASEWDRIEYALQNEELWYFINNNENKFPTRIECIFDIMYIDAKNGCNETKYRRENKIESQEEIKKRKESGYFTFDEKFGIDQSKTFRFFSEKFKTKSKNEIDINWSEIKKIFQTIEEWFLDRELYHKVGYLIATGIKITDLLKEVNSKKKQEFRKLLDSKIAEIVKCDELEKLVYGPQSDKIRKILLLHNIKTMLSNKEEKSRFPFDRFKDKKIGWDIEHIHAIATEVNVEEKDQQNWLDNNFVEGKDHNNEEQNKKIALIKRGTAIDKEEFKSIIEYVLGEEDNSIRNLCLLDRGTNRSYKNASFKVKRKTIIENEKKGIFIPVCTRNVFMKYYSEELNNLELWNEQDRESYMKEISKVIFLNENK